MSRAVCVSRLVASAAQNHGYAMSPLEKHTPNIFSKLDLHRPEDDHRRILVVLAWLEG